MVRPKSFWVPEKIWFSEGSSRNRFSQPRVSGKFDNLQPVVGLGVSGGGTFGQHRQSALDSLGRKPGGHIGIPVFRVRGFENRVDPGRELQLLAGGFLGGNGDDPHREAKAGDTSRRFSPMGGDEEIGRASCRERV